MQNSQAWIEMNFNRKKLKRILQIFRFEERVATCYKIFYIQHISLFLVEQNLLSKQIDEQKQEEKSCINKVGWCVVKKGQEADRKWEREEK